MNKKAIYVPKGFRLGFILSVLLILAVLTSTLDSASAQSGIGSIEGTVTDPTGAVVPGAAIHVVNNGTHVAVDAKSNGAGFFQVPGLFTGTYAVTISATGMKTYQTSIELLVAQTAVINPQLTIGAATQEVIVNANSVQLTTNDSASISSTLEYQRINQLPENGREITTLLQETTPGLENVSKNQGGNIDGLNVEALQYIVDGANLASNEFGGLQFGLTQLIDPDAVQEAHVEISNGGAQYGSPATVVMSTRSGTDHLHGTLFETARNNAFGVARPVDTLNYVFPQLIRNEFGVSAGGPVIIPHLYHGRDKTFWFFAYERYSDAEQLVGLASVPTYNTPGMTGPGAGMNNGDFSALVTAAGKTDVLYDPSTTYNATTCAATGKANAYCRTPFANNQIPRSEESPFAKVYYDIIPKPNVPNVTDPLVQNNLSYTSPTYEVVDQQTARVDQAFNENNRAFVRFTRVGNPVNISSGTAPRNLAADGIPNGAALGYANNIAHTYTAATDYTHVFSPSLFAETVYSMQWFTSHHLSGNAATTDYESMLSLPNNFGEVGFPAVTGLLEPLTSSQANNLANLQIDILLGENLTKTIGRHQIYFGGRFNHDRNAEKPNGLADSVAFGALATGVYQPTSGTTAPKAVTNTGYADADMFLGSAASYHVTLEPPFVHSHLNEFDAYVQDNFHVSPKLTLNFGLRYEAHPALWTKDGLANSFDLKNDAMVLAAPISELIAKGYTTQAIITNDQNIGVKFETAQEAGFPANTLMYNYDFNFLPRLGVAWIPFRSGTIFRGGFGQYEYATPLSDYSLQSQSNNPFTAGYNMSYITAAQAIDALPNEQLRYKVQTTFPVAGTAASASAVNSSSTNSILPGISLSSPSPNWKPVVVNQANFTIEQPLPGHSALRVTYLYSHAGNLDMEDSYNNHPSVYQYEAAYGQAPPTGTVIGSPTYSTTATGPYDQTTWAGGSTLETTNGWSNYNALQVNYQRLYHRGVAYQISYVYGKSMRAGGDLAGAKSILSKTDFGSVVDVDPAANFPGVLGNVSQMSVLAGGSTPYAGAAPPPRPAGLPVWADYHAMDRYQLYQFNSNIPKMDIKFNGILDLPIGRGKWLLHNSPRWLNEIIGGFQIAGDGNVISQVFIPDSTMWGPTSKIQVYKHKIPVTDCRSGACNKGYLWFNGYLSPLVIGANCPNQVAGLGGCVTGVPANYQPYQTPINNTPNTPATNPPTSPATNQYFAGEDVQLTLPGTTPINPTTGQYTNTQAYDAGPVGSNYTSKTYLSGPINWNADLSLFKVFPIKGSMNLRLNFDAFNAFNHPGDVNPSPVDGVENFLTAYNNPRQLQITARFTF